MTSKKILAAALSFGLLFAGASDPVFAQTSEMTEEQKSEYNSIKQKIKNQQDIKIIEISKKISVAEENKNVAEKTRNGKREEIKQLNAQLKEKQEIASEDLTEEEISKLDIEIENLKAELTKKEEELIKLEEEYTKKEEEYNYLHENSTRERSLKNAYDRAKSFLEFDIADTSYEVRGYALENIITKEDRENFIKGLSVAKTYDDLNKIKANISNLINGETQLKEEPSNNQDPTSPQEQNQNSNNPNQLELAKEEALKILEENKEISEEEKEEFKKQIQQAADIEQVDEIVEEIKNFKAASKPSDEQSDDEDQSPQTSSEDTQAEENEESKALNESKQSAKDELEKNENLSDEEKKDFKEKIDSTQDKESLEKIIQDIKKAGEDKTLSDPSPKEEIKEKPTPETPSIDPDEKPKENIPEDQPTPSTDDDLDKLPETKPLDTPKDKQEDTLLAKPEEKTNPIEKVLTKTTPETPKSNPSYLYRILESTYPDFGTIRIVGPTGKDYITTIENLDEKPQVAKDTIVVENTYKYIKKGIYKLADLETTRDKLQKSIAHNKATVRAIELLEELTPKTVAKNREKINALLKESERLLKEANYALAEYNYVLSK
ncbi:hypothetical protein AB9Q04_03550 [Anaerococcus sp. ENR1011]|uniref:Protein G-related albumin-binding (GA) module domain-containing protein n=1 Tax=Anaerococcus groningensis TaxID=3115616 RepID=A0ABW9N052_9FIRM